MPAEAPRRVLVVEDNKYMQMFYRTALRRGGYEVTVAASGEEALPKAAECHPDIVILDLLLPHTQGKDVLRELKASATFASVPIVVISSMVPADQVRLGREGVTRYIHKEKLTQELLLTSLEEALAGTTTASVVKGDSE